MIFRRDFFGHKNIAQNRILQFNVLYQKRGFFPIFQGFFRLLYRRGSRITANFEKSNFSRLKFIIFVKLFCTLTKSGLLLPFLAIVSCAFCTISALKFLRLVYCAKPTKALFFVELPNNPSENRVRVIMQQNRLKIRALLCHILRAELT